MSELRGSVYDKQPVFNPSGNFFMLTLPNQNYVDPVNDPVNDPVKLTDRQNMILQMFDEDKTLSKERLCEKMGLSKATIKREIAYLKSIGKLKRIGSDKTGY